ncbi:hypothetical protein H5410_033871 [Solanum commersonii]|uniref:Uncharacterized protein n=1 Tax=Solanum commersonii TaxID=4109 RepID=A0A9J5YRI4_SOLCO|nr:hypothetical protein H5410_033871 [Solanum commersonii]
MKAAYGQSHESPFSVRYSGRTILKFYHYARRTVPLPSFEFPRLSHSPATGINQQQPPVPSTSSTHSSSSRQPGSHQSQSTSRVQAAGRTAANHSEQQPETGRRQPLAFSQLLENI